MRRGQAVFVVAGACRVAPQIQVIPIFLRSSPHLPVMCDRANSVPSFKPGLSA
jgi:hypothetical protein